MSAKLRASHLHLWERAQEVVVHRVQIAEEGEEVLAKGAHDGHVAVVDEGVNGEHTGLAEALFLRELQRLSRVTE